MKRRILLLLTAIVLCFLAITAISCGQNEKIVLNVYNWGEYISDGTDDSLDVNAAFEEYCSEQGLDVEVNYMMFDSNESMYNKIKTGAVSYDVVIPSDYMVARMIAEDMLEPLNFENIPNYKYVDPVYTHKYYDPYQIYSVPYFVGVVGIIYNTKHVDPSTEEDVINKSWDLLWNEKYSGKILQFNNARDAFGTALFRQGKSVNLTDEAVWRSALADLKAQKPLLQAYVMDEIFNKMETGSAWIAPYYAGDFLAMYEENPDLDFYIPSGGTNVFADAMCIPKDEGRDPQTKKVAEMYINFMLEKDIGAANSEFVYYSTPNTLVNSDAEYNEYMESIYEGAIENVIAPQFPEGYNLEYYHNFDDETLIMVNSLWEELKIDSGTDDGSVADVGVYVTCAVIVVAVAAGFTVRYIIHRKRRKYY